MTRVFFHAATRVIRKLSNADLRDEPLPDEDFIDVEGDWDTRRHGKFWKLDARNVPVEATAAEVSAADVDQEQVDMKKEILRLDVDAAAQSICDDAKLTFEEFQSRVRSYFIALRNLK